MPESAETSRVDSNSSNGPVEMESCSPVSLDLIRDCTVLEALCSPESPLNSVHESSDENNGMNEEEIETIRKLAQSIHAGLCLNLDSSEDEATSIWKLTAEESQRIGVPEYCDFENSNTVLSEEILTAKESGAENSPDRECYSEEDINLMRENLFLFQWNGISKESISEALKHLFKPTVGGKPHGSDAVDEEAYSEEYSLQTSKTVASVLNHVLNEPDEPSYKPVDYIEVQNLTLSCELDQAVSAHPILESCWSSSDSPNRKDGASIFLLRSEINALEKFRDLIHGLTNTLQKIDDLLKVMDGRSHWKRMIRKGRFPFKDMGLLFDSVPDSFPFPPRIDMDSRILKLWTETRPTLSKLAVFLRKIMISSQNPMTSQQIRAALISIRKTISAITTPENVREYSDLCEKLPVSFNASSDARYVFGVERRVFAVLVDLMNVIYEIDRLNDGF